jgi:hypothetical protein
LSPHGIPLSFSYGEPVLGSRTVLLAVLRNHGYLPHETIAEQLEAA